MKNVIMGFIVAMALCLTGCAETSYHANGDITTTSVGNACSVALVNGATYVTCASSESAVAVVGELRTGIKSKLVKQ